MHPITRGEDYVADLQNGWLAVEAAHDKRRLEAPYREGSLSVGARIAQFDHGSAA